MESRSFIFIAAIALMSLCSGQSPPPIPIPFTPPPPLPIPPELRPFGYCDATVPLGTMHWNCSSCRDRCNDIKNFRIKTFCSCDANCVAYGDCCVDFEQACPVQFNASSSLRRHFKHRKTECYTVRTVPLSDANIVGIRAIVPSFNEYNFVAVCGQTGTVCNRTSSYRILEPNLAIPVTDPETGISYVNFKCAQCNNVKKVTPWIPQMACSSDRVDFDSQNGTFSIDTEGKLEMFLSLCSINYMIPASVTARQFCGGFNSECSPSCNNTDLINHCENSYIVNYVISTRSRYKIYDNHYCALCAGEIAASLQCTEIEYFDRAASGRGGSFSLSLLFDFDPSEGVTVGRKACSAGQKWIEALGDCRRVACPEDQRLVDEACLPATLNMTLSASLFFNLTKDLDSVIENLESDTLLSDSLNQKLKQLLLMDDDIIVLFNHSKSSDSTLNVTLGINLFFHKNSSFNFESDLGNFSDSAIEAFDDELVLLMQRSGVNLGNVVIVVDENLVLRQPLLDDCTWLSFSREEFVQENGTVIIISTKNVYSMERFRLVSDKALVCIQNENMNDVRLDVSEVLGILTLVLITLSILCLAVRLALQFKVTYYASFAGKLHFNLCLSLCLAFLMLILGGVVFLYGKGQVGLCTVFGTLMYWLFLTAFVWMSAVTFDTWLIFRPSATFVKADDTNKSLIKYVLPCWLIPAAIAVIVTCLDFSNMDPRFKPQFGVHLCWFNQRYALLVFFGVPVALLIFITTIFFILTVLYLRRTINSSARASIEKQSHQIWIYFRLYVLMGISWLFGFVAAFVGHDALWIIFIILNASQGILIFISFVLNRKVLDEIRTLRKRPTRSGTAMTSSTELSSGNHPSRSYVPIQKGGASSSSV